MAAVQESDLARLHNDAIKNDPFISKALGPNPKCALPAPQTRSLMQLPPHPAATRMLPEPLLVISAWHASPLVWCKGLLLLLLLHWRAADNSADMRSMHSGRCSAG